MGLTEDCWDSADSAASSSDSFVVAVGTAFVDLVESYFSFVVVVESLAFAALVVVAVHLAPSFEVAAADFVEDGFVVPCSSYGLVAAAFAGMMVQVDQLGVALAY
ncbi:hypothetical protein GCK72_024232 [Caenorhabditis remanei]|uniref:Uncharacterized protein n=1 Tax=Caenorhabditis remanei TaxID=31234 RepID=A0A6A5FYQ5_CAERE|nr:hypothetical protein GCK72_024232 [Caenorhabditis remanei]KAF1747766.1 hypothetical protein GCK72_024232 [Caenorhabditis remanei]